MAQATFSLLPTFSIIRDLKAGLIVAKIIEFYTPSTFRRNGKWIPLEQRGKLIEFVPVPERKKSA
jgi:hypothetical protein